MPLIPILGILLPSLIKTAEHVFDKKNDPEVKLGEVKKQYVLNLLSNLYDSLHLEKMLPDFPNVDEKKMFLGFAAVAIDHLVPELKD